MLKIFKIANNEGNLNLLDERIVITLQMLELKNVQTSHCCSHFTVESQTMFAACDIFPTLIDIL